VKLAPNGSLKPFEYSATSLSVLEDHSPLELTQAGIYFYDDPQQAPQWLLVLDWKR
jgi:hypothetical protein